MRATDINRRQALGTLAGGMLAGIAGGQASLASGKARLSNIGLQLYTVRDHMKNDVASTLAAVAEMGYREVEFAHYFDHSASELNRMLNGEGLRSPSTHIRMPPLREDADAVFAFAKEVGHDHVVVPFIKPNERSLDHYKRHIEFFAKMGEKSCSHGLRFGFHNHDFEFEVIDGVRPYDLMLSELDASLIQFTMDLYWFNRAGADPLDYIRRHPGRFELCHVKDMRVDGSQTSVGAGVIDFAAIFNEREKAGFQHYYVEQDKPEDSYAAVRSSFKYLQQLEFRR